MKVAIIDKVGKKVSEMELDISGDIRDDIFKKAVLSENSLFRQKQGADPEAGKKAAIHNSKRRKRFRTTYGRAQARTPKKVMWSRGTQLRYVGAFAPNTVGGRQAHPPKAEKDIFKNVNNKEWLKALKIGFIASMTSSVVSKNGQKVPTNYPMIMDQSVETIDKTKEFVDLLSKLGFTEELDRTSVTKVRAGRGTMRNRTYKVKRGPLVVVSSYESPLLKSARNVKGFDIITPELLMVSDFGMSEKPGRVVLFSKAAIEQFKEVLVN